MTAKTKTTDSTTETEEKAKHTATESQEKAKHTATESREKAPSPEEVISDLYTERAHLVALLAKDYPSAYVEDTDDEGWIIVYVDLPTGQASWHIAPDDQHLFAGVRFAPDIDWDGHTPEEKYARMRKLIGGEE